MSDKFPWTMDATTAVALAMLGSASREAITTMMESSNTSRTRMGPYGRADGAANSDARWHGVIQIDMDLKFGEKLSATIWFDVPAPGSLSLGHGVLTVRPPLPDTICIALASRPLTTIADHPLLAGLTIESCDSSDKGTRVTISTEPTGHLP